MPATTTATKPEVSKLILPTVAADPTFAWREQKFLMMGAGKIGKSEFWAQGKDTFFLETEAGLGHLKVKKLPCRSWGDLREVYNLLYQAAQDGKFPYDTVVVDTIDRVISYAEEEALQRAYTKFSPEVNAKINAIGDIPNGAGWFWVKGLVENFIGKLEELPAAVVLIGHVNSKEIKEPTRSYHKDTISIGGQVGIKLLHWADHTLHIRSRLSGETLDRTIRTLPSQTLEAGSRGRVIPDNTKWVADAAKNYAEFRKLFT